MARARSASLAPRGLPRQLLRRWWSWLSQSEERRTRLNCSLHFGVVDIAGRDLGDYGGASVLRRRGAFRPLVLSAFLIGSCLAVNIS
jgi:hypothetical protein